METSLARNPRNVSRGLLQIQVKSIPTLFPTMKTNVEKCMTSIVRSAGILCLLVAAWQLIDLGQALWAHRDALASVSGYSAALEVMGALVTGGTLLCIFGGRLGPWLCKDPVKHKRKPAHPYRPVAPTQQLVPAEREAEE